MKKEKLTLLDHILYIMAIVMASIFFLLAGQTFSIMFDLNLYSYLEIIYYINIVISLFFGIMTLIGKKDLGIALSTFIAFFFWLGYLNIIWLYNIQKEKNRLIKYELPLLVYDYMRDNR